MGQRPRRVGSGGQTGVPPLGSLDEEQRRNTAVSDKGIGHVGLSQGFEALEVRQEGGGRLLEATRLGARWACARGPQDGGS